MSKPSNLIERIVAGVTMFIAFMVMASIFVPHDTQARDGAASHGEHDAAGHGAAQHGYGSPSESPAHGASIDPHEGLPCLGSLLHSCYEVDMYATQYGTRYTVYDASNGEELGVLLTVEQVEQYYPDLPLRNVDFSAPTSSQLMLADPQH